MTRVIAIDWSGDAKHASEKIWTAVVEDGELIELRNGRAPFEVRAFLEQQMRLDRDLYVGFDFAFSFPSWFVKPYGSSLDLWRAIDDARISDWKREVAPFYGTLNSVYEGEGEALRTTDRAMVAKSAFKVSGIGSVGTGSIRGMPLLAELERLGFSIWPFMPPGSPLVIEIYPRANLDPQVARSIAARFAKTNPSHRRGYLSRKLTGVWLDLAASSEDSFDAATSAFAMWEELADLRSLPVIHDVTLRGEGIIWSPRWRTVHKQWLQGEASP